MLRICKVVLLAGVMLCMGVLSGNAASQVVKGAESAPAAKVGQAKDPVTRQLDAMTRRLGLSAEQQEAIRPIIIEEMGQLNALRAADNMTVDEKKVKRQELRDAASAKIGQILTEEQRAKRDEMFKKAIDRRQSKENKGVAPAPAK